MKVKIRFFGFLAVKVGKQVLMNTKEGTELGKMVVKVFKEYGLGRFDPESPSAKARVTPGFLRVFLNGKEESFDYQLKEGDEIMIFPPLVGGLS